VLADRQIEVQVSRQRRTASLMVDAKIWGSHFSLRSPESTQW